MYSRSIPDMAASTVNTIAGGIVGALELPGEELQTDVAGLQLLGEHGEFDAAAEPLVLVDDEGDAYTGGADLSGEFDGGLQFGARGGAGGDLFSEKTRVTPASARESGCASRDCRAVEARA
ncbi:hypothetical protein GCM10023080_062160 [Streptomyces pseudoechinosporeus]